MSYRSPQPWSPIEDLPQDWRSMASAELPSLLTFWQEQAAELRDSGAYETFMDKMNRQIAIETGVIERLYDIDRGITEQLIEYGLDVSLLSHDSTDIPPTQVIALIRDQEAAVEGLFSFVKGERRLSASYLRELHQALTAHQTTTEALISQTGEITIITLIRGDWKKWPNNPTRSDGTVYEYSPPEQVDSEVEQLVCWHREHQDIDVAPEVEAAWLHHRFTQIHPFQDGNGRVARCLASLVFIQAGWFPVVLTRDDRAQYIDALERADAGNLSALVTLFVNQQKKSLRESLSLSSDALREVRYSHTTLDATIDALISVVTGELEKRDAEILLDRQRKAVAYAAILFDMSDAKFRDTADAIQLRLKNVRNDVQVYPGTGPANTDRAHWYGYQVIETAKRQHYYANRDDYCSWVLLGIKVNSNVELLLSFHVLGRQHLGLLACSMCAYRKELDEEGRSIATDLQPLSEAPFTFSYADSEGNLRKRFSEWLGQAIKTGMIYWSDRY